MITFAEIRDGEEFVSGNGVYMKVPEMKTSIGKCEACGIGINAVIIGRQDGAPLTDSSGRPILPWGVHFCPSQKVRGLSLSMWEVNARRWQTKAMVPMALVDAVAAAVERLSRPGIEGWGLRICEDMAAAGELVEVSERIGCTSETCAHVSHDPAAPMCRWLPRSGQLVELGSDEEPGEIIVRWFAHLDGDTTRYIQVEESRSYHAAAQYTESVPDWVLARLAQGAAV